MSVSSNLVNEVLTSTAPLHLFLFLTLKSSLFWFLLCLQGAKVDVSQIEEWIQFEKNSVNTTSTTAGAPGKDFAYVTLYYVMNTSLLSACWFRLLSERDSSFNVWFTLLALEPPQFNKKSLSESKRLPVIRAALSSPVRFLFNRLLLFLLGYPAGASAEERGAAVSTHCCRVCRLFSSWQVPCDAEWWDAAGLAFAGYWGSAVLKRMNV